MAIIKCGCKDDGKGNTQGVKFQEEKYGIGYRVGNEKLKIQGREQEYSCTVCGTVTTKIKK